ncbi:hypothetical protein RRF57_005860 [Xylaria bambusicola]|uniref:Uncharacterized protein n=1 Tax=Xylaria bambusicola TaxID=326684 RepID=A0AAN7UDC2_9PEZI
MAFPAGSASAAIAVMAKIGRPNPFSAFCPGAVVAVSVKKTCELFIPGPFEIIVEQTIDMLEWNDIVGAAFRRHVLSIFD